MKHNIFLLIFFSMCLNCYNIANSTSCIVHSTNGAHDNQRDTAVFNIITAKLKQVITHYAKNSAPYLNTQSELTTFFHDMKEEPIKFRGLGDLSFQLTALTRENNEMHATFKPDQSSIRGFVNRWVTENPIAQKLRKRSQQRMMEKVSGKLSNCAIVCKSDVALRGSLI